MDTIRRDGYLSQLIAGRGNGLIKVVTGIRRCGKSYLLFNIFREYLHGQGVDEGHIISVAFDDLENEELTDPHKLLAYVKGRMTDKGQYLILLDEVQMLRDFVGVLNSLLRVSNADVYVTGSNSKFLSSDVATEFRGRGDEIRLYPLSFAEFLSARGGEKQEAWQEYCTYGGLPLVLSLESRQKKMAYLRNLFRTVYLRDIVERNGIKKVDEFEQLARVMASSIGSPCSPLRLANTFRSAANIGLNAETIGIYLAHLQNAFVLEKSLRFDIKGRKHIGTSPKYYFTDAGLRNALLDFRQQEESHLMENIIYNELRMRGFLVDVGMVEQRSSNGTGGSVRRQLEVDFVANLGSRRYYIQSALAIPNREKMAQETASLDMIADSFKKVVIVRDSFIPWHNERGALMLGLFDFLLKPESLDM